jgi:hypothetical protein
VRPRGASNACLLRGVAQCLHLGAEFLHQGAQRAWLWRRCGLQFSQPPGKGFAIRQAGKTCLGQRQGSSEPGPAIQGEGVSGQHLFARYRPRVSALRVAGAHVKEQMKNQILACQRFAYSEGQDLPGFAGWQRPEQ